MIRTKTLKTMLLLLIGFSLPLAAQYSGGSGTESDPYQLSTLHDLKELSLTEGDWASCFVLNNDIDASETNTWYDADSSEIVGLSRIGYDVNNCFKGVFDGNGYTISNLYIYLPDETFVGLFGHAGNSENQPVIKNLTLENADITGSQYVGALVGKAPDIQIINCHTSAQVEATASSGSYAGGIVGYASGYIYNSTSSGYINGGEYVGGLAGKVYANSAFDIEVFRCYSSAKVNATGGYGGGLVGQASASFNSCYATGDVTGSSRLGGFSGYSSGSDNNLQYCFATGDVTGRNYLGGFTGWSYAYTSQCYAAGKVTSNSSGSYVGGFKGYYVADNTTDNYYNVDSAGIADDGSEGITGMSTAEMADESSFENWNFTDDWIMTANTIVSPDTRPYPRAFLFDYFIGYDQTIPAAGSITSKEGWYNYGDEVTITASAAIAPYVWGGWYNGDTKLTESLSYTFTVTGDITCTANYVAEYSGGSGTEADPYRISTLEDLKVLVETEVDYDKSFILVNDIDASETSTWQDEEDGDIVGFIPIGSMSAPFKGTFDGQGYTISNLYINRPEASSQVFVGLFGYTWYATLKNINMSGHSLTGNDWVGAIVARTYFTDIENCHVDGDVTGVSAVGGLAGYLNNGSLENSSSKGTVTGTDVYAGGLVAHSSYTKILLSHSEADVTGYSGVGGLVGMSFKGNGKYCYATGDVEGREFVGGLVGMDGNWAYSFATGAVSQADIEGSEDDYGYVGGFVGDRFTGILKYCYSTGMVYGIANYGGFYGGEAPSEGATISRIDPVGCVFDINTSGQTDQGREGVTGLNTTQFANTAKYPDWDFDYYWDLQIVSEFDNVTRPYFKSLTGYDYEISSSCSNELAGEISVSKDAGWYVDGDTITLSTTVNLGYEFKGWYLDDVLVSEEATYVDTITASGEYVAKYKVGDYEFAGGAGTALNPYQISTLEHLNLLSNLIPTLKDKYFIVINDIDASGSETLWDGEGFLPIGYKIGSTNYLFSGKLDGQGYTISNLTINRPDTYGVGLFTAINGTVTNLHLANCNVTGGSNTGVLAGYITKNGAVEYCNVTESNITGEAGTGGLIGVTYSVGEMDIVSTVTNSFVNKSIVTGTVATGGLIGAANSNVNLCYAKASVTGTEYVGGLCGSFTGASALKISLSASYSDSLVTGNMNVGGLIGYVSSSALVSECYSLADVNVLEGSYEEYGRYAGGLIGYLYEGDVENCYALGTVNAVDKSGGLIGEVSSKSTVTSSYTASPVEVLGTYNGGITYRVNNANAEVTDVYFDTETTGMTKGIYNDISNVADVTGLNTASFAVQDSLEGFDFIGIWGIRAVSETDTVQRPFLKWQNNNTHIIASITPENSGAISGAGYYNIGDTVTLVATPKPGWKFVSWKVNKEVRSTSATYDFEVEKAVKYVFTATFVEDFSAEGTGTESDPYQIRTLGQLEELGYLPTLWDKNFILMNDIDATETYTWNVGDHDKDNQTEDKAMGFIPLGDNSAGLRSQVFFTGTFDGQGYTIYNLYINRPSDRNLGFFGRIKGATITNLNIDNAKYTGGDYMGGLVGGTYRNTDSEDSYINYIDNCTVSNATINGDLQTGGLMGSVYYSDVTNSFVTNSYILGTGNNGGLIGEALNAVTISNCSSSGRVYATGLYAGGLIGRANSACVIENSNSSNKVTTAQQAGGLVGMLSSESIVRNCYATGDVKGTGTYAMAGGLIGGFSYSEVSESYATGNVTTLDIYAGGFIGYSEGGLYSSVDRCYSTGNVYGLRFIGGFFGVLNCQVTNSYSLGDVDGTSDSPSDDLDIQIGGFAGRINSYGEVSNCFTISDVKGHIYVGGFVGVSAGTIENSYCASTVEATGYYPGAFAGYMYESETSIIIGAYYDDDYADGISAVGSGTSDGITGITTEQFATSANMPEFDFYGVWKIETNEAIDPNDRPYLKFEESEYNVTVEQSQEYAATIKGAGWYNTGDTVNLVVSDEQPGLVFDHWEKSGEVVSSDRGYKFVFDAGEDLIFLAVFNEVNSIANGSGTEADPYVINSYDDLICLSNNPSIWDKHFILANDIDASATRLLNKKQGFSPIGNSEDQRFTGSFDGQGYSIDDLYINRTKSEYAQALFGYAGDADSDPTVITNLNMGNVGVGGTYGVASLVGDMENGIVENCNVDGFILGTKSYIGGLIGRSRSDSKVSYSSFKGDVYCPNGTYYTSTGGLIGYNRNSDVYRCYVVADSIVSYGEHVGGLVGFNHDTTATGKYSVSQCFVACGYVTTAADYLGGLVGANNGALISESYAVTEIEQSNSYAFEYGGLVGGDNDGFVEKSYFNSDYFSKNNGLAIAMQTDDFEKTTLFEDWNFDEEGGWKMAVGYFGELRPYFFETPSYEITYKAGDNGLITIKGKNNPVDEITDQVIEGVASRTVRAIPNAGGELIRWETAAGNTWDDENTSTYVPAVSEDVTLVAVFEGDNTSINSSNIQNLLVYPNPATDRIYLEGVPDNATIRIMDVSGKQMYTGEFDGRAINVSHMTGGLYTVTIEADDNVSQIKLIIK